MSARILSGIYAIRNTLNGKVYVGSAVNVDARWVLHRLHLNRGSHHCPPLQHAWVKHGDLAFVFEIIEAVERRKEALHSREQAHLDDAFATGLAYNVCRTAASCLGIKRSAETRAKQSAALGGRKLSPEHVAKIVVRMRGHNFSPEHLAKATAATRGRKRTAEDRAKMSASRRNSPDIRWIEFNGKRAPITDWGRALGMDLSLLQYRLAHWPLERALTEPVGMQGRVRSPETIAKHAAAIRGRKLSAEHRAKIGASGRGRKKSAEHRAKISVGLRGKQNFLGRKHTAETLARMSASQRARYA